MESSLLRPTAMSFRPIDGMSDNGPGSGGIVQAIIAEIDEIRDGAQEGRAASCKQLLNLVKQYRRDKNGTDFREATHVTVEGSSSPESTPLVILTNAGVHIDLFTVLDSLFDERIEASVRKMAKCISSEETLSSGSGGMHWLPEFQASLVHAGKIAAFLVNLLMCSQPDVYGPVRLDLRPRALDRLYAMLVVMLQEFVYTESAVGNLRLSTSPEMLSVYNDGATLGIHLSELFHRLVSERGSTNDTLERLASNQNMLAVVLSLVHTIVFVRINATATKRGCGFLVRLGREISVSEAVNIERTDILQLYHLLAILGKIAKASPSGDDIDVSSNLSTIIARLIMNGKEGIVPSGIGVHSFVHKIVHPVLGWDALGVEGDELDESFADIVLVGSERFDSLTEDSFSLISRVRLETLYLFGQLLYRSYDLRSYLIKQCDWGSRIKVLLSGLFDERPVHLAGMLCSSGASPMAEVLEGGPLSSTMRELCFVLSQLTGRCAVRDEISAVLGRLEIVDLLMSLLSTLSKACVEGDMSRGSTRTQNGDVGWELARLAAHSLANLVADKENAMRVAALSRSVSVLLFFTVPREFIQWLAVLFVEHDSDAAAADVSNLLGTPETPGETALLSETSAAAWAGPGAPAGRRSHILRLRARPIPSSEDDQGMIKSDLLLKLNRVVKRLNQQTGSIDVLDESAWSQEILCGIVLKYASMTTTRRSLSFHCLRALTYTLSFSADLVVRSGQMIVPFLLLLLQVEAIVNRFFIAISPAPGSMRSERSRIDRGVSASSASFANVVSALELVQRRADADGAVDDSESTPGGDSDPSVRQEAYRSFQQTIWSALANGERSSSPDFIQPAEFSRVVEKANQYRGSKYFQVQAILSLGHICKHILIHDKARRFAAVPILLMYLTPSTSEEVVKQASRTMANMAGILSQDPSASLGEVFASYDTVPRLLKLLGSSKCTELNRCTLHAVANLLNGHQNMFQFHYSDGIRCIMPYLLTPSEAQGLEVPPESMNTYCSSYTNERVQTQALRVLNAYTTPKSTSISASRVLEMDALRVIMHLIRVRMRSFSKLDGGGLSTDPAKNTDLVDWNALVMDTVFSACIVFLSNMSMYTLARSQFSTCGAAVLMIELLKPEHSSAVMYGAAASADTQLQYHHVAKLASQILANCALEGHCNLQMGENGVLPTLAFHLKHSKDGEVLRCSAHALGNFCSLHCPERFEQLTELSIPTRVCELLKEAFQERILDALMLAVTSLARSDRRLVDQLRECGIVDILKSHRDGTITQADGSHHQWAEHVRAQIRHTLNTVGEQVDGESHALTAADLARLPVLQVDKMFLKEEHDRCSVCFEDYAEGEKVYTLVPCRHYFHCQCLEHWLTKSKACPLCRTEIDVSSVAGECAQSTEVEMSENI